MTLTNSSHCFPKKQGDIAAKSHSGITCFMLASQHDTPEMIHAIDTANIILRKAGASLLDTDTHGNTAIDLAVENGDVEVLQKLVRLSGFRIHETKNNFGVSALDRSKMKETVNHRRIQRMIEQENLFMPEHTEMELKETAYLARVKAAQEKEYFADAGKMTFSR
jgi:hypothetical protein